MSDQYESAFSLVLVIMVASFFALLKLLLSRLEHFHPKVYRAMGEPVVFDRSRAASLLALLKFVAAREHRALDDRRLSWISDALLAWLAGFLMLSVWPLLR